MRYSKLYTADVVNGEGVRVTLFLTGCKHMCEGCYNRSTWKSSSGDLFTEDIENTILENLSKPYVKGLTLTGGDPLHEANLQGVFDLITKVKNLYNDKDIWLWSGYTLKELESNKDDSVVDNLRYKVCTSVDVFIDGRFELGLKDPSLKWRGSSNQIIHVFTE